MAHLEHPTIEGVLVIELRDRLGALVEARTVHNLITTAGKSLLAKLLGGQVSGAVELSIGVGEGTTAASVADEALGDMASEAAARMSAPKFHEVDGVDGDAGDVRVTVEANVTEGGTEERSLPLTEAGILVRVGDDATGVLFNRVTFPVINKGPNMTLLLSWELTF